MAPQQQNRQTTEPIKDETADQDRRQRDTPKDIWDVQPDDQVDTRKIITDWASL